jgi:hypothetical protein
VTDTKSELLIENQGKFIIKSGTISFTKIALKINSNAN